MKNYALQTAVNDYNILILAEKNNNCG